MAENINNKLKVFLSGKSISVTIVLLAIGSRILQLVFFFNLRVDGMYQYLAMKNFVSGHGVSIAEVLPGDLAKPIFEPLINWPPGYSILLSPFYILFNHNYVAAGLTLDIIAAIALIIFTRKILRLLETPTYLINVFTIFCGFYMYNFYLIASSDAIAISLFIIIIHQTLLLLKSNSNWLPRAIFISFLLILCGFIKYLFYPVVFAVPVFLIIKGVVDKQKAITKAGFFSILMITICLLSLLLYQKSISGAAAFISQPERGFYPENLKEAYPFITGSLVNPETITRALSSLKGAETSIFRIFQLVHLLSLLGIVYCTIKWIRKNSFKNLSLINSFYTLSMLITIAITGLLFILSITVAKEEINPGVFWSYIEDARYHGLITVLFQMSLFILLYQLSASSIKKWKFVPVFILLLLIPETFRGIIFDTNRILNFKNEEYSWQSELKLQQFAEALILKKKESLNVDKTAVTGSSYYINNRVCLYSNAYYLKNQEILNSNKDLNSTENTLLLVIIEKTKLNYFTSMLDNTELTFEGESDGISFFTTLIKPH